MAEVQKQVRIKLVPRSRPGSGEQRVLKPIYFPAIITTNTETGAFRVSVNIAAKDAQPDYKIVATMDGSVARSGGSGSILGPITDPGRRWDGTVKINDANGPIFVGDGIDDLVRHLEVTNNLGELENENIYDRTALVRTGMHYGDSSQGLPQAKELSADIFNENASVEARQRIVKLVGNDSYATTPTAEQIEADKKKNEQKTGETVQPDSDGDGDGDGGGTDEPPQRQWDGQFDQDPTAGFAAVGAPGANLSEGINGYLSYPEDLEVSQQDYLKISCYTYKPQTLAKGQIATISGKGEKVGPDVYLPINSASDTSTVGWGDQSANPLQIGLYQAAASFIGADLRDLGNVFSDLGQAAKGLLDTSEMMRPAIKSYFASQAAGVTGMLSRTTGAVFNPNLVLLFNSPELRKFSFTFRMSARSDTEAVIIRRIIRYFKQYSKPGLSAAKLFLTTPYVFTVQYKVPGDGTHKSIGQPKDACALTSVGVNYVPDGTYMTFNDPAKTMTAYELTLNFSELEPIYRSDYEQPADEIGW